MKLFAPVFFIVMLAFFTPSAHAETKYEIKLPPSAQLVYDVNADIKGFPLNGEARMNWQVLGSSPHQTYSITTQTRSALFGKILEANSYGDVDTFGLAPKRYEEKPWRKSIKEVTFDRESEKIHFPDSNATYPLSGGEQDRTSAIWQLISIARAAPKKFTPNSTWSFFVAGRRNAEKWTFTVDKNVTLETAFGKISTVHITKSTTDAKDQRIEIWLAPSKEWYPVRIKSRDPDGDTIEQDLVRIED